MKVEIALMWNPLGDWGEGGRGGLNNSNRFETVGIIGRFRKHATPNRDVKCLGMAWARLPVNREVTSAWSSRPKKVFSDVLSAAPCFWGPSTPFSLQYHLRQHVPPRAPRSMMTYHIAIWRRIVFSKSAYWQVHAFLASIRAIIMPPNNVSPKPHASTTPPPPSPAPLPPSHLYHNVLEFTLSLSMLPQDFMDTTGFSLQVMFSMTVSSTELYHDVGPF